MLTDFGADSRYVGELKGALLAVNPAARIVDLTHSVPPQDLATASRWLADTAATFPAGTLHIAVVDPGVGTDRQIVYAEFGGQRVICPNNGLLTNLAEVLVPAKIMLVENRRFWRAEISATFHGRDIMAPVAAHLSRGVPVEEIGTELPCDALVRLPNHSPTPVPMALDSSNVIPGEGGVAQRIDGEVIEIDSFGNLITNITAGSLEGAPRNSELVITCDEHKTFGLQTTYADQPAMTFVALFGSGDRLELAIVDESAAAMLGIPVGAAVVIEW